MSELLEQQNMMIISLLAQSTLGIDRIERIVRKNKKKGAPDNFVLAYNALDGSKTATDIAKIIGISQQGMSAVLQTWEEEGIVYKVGKSGRYIGLLRLPIKATKPAKLSKGKKKPAKQSEENKGLSSTGETKLGYDEVQPA